MFRFPSVSETPSRVIVELDPSEPGAKYIVGLLLISSTTICCVPLLLPENSVLS